MYLFGKTLESASGIELINCNIRLILYKRLVSSKSHIDNIAPVLQGLRQVRIQKVVVIINSVHLPYNVIAFFSNHKADYRAS